MAAFDSPEQMMQHMQRQAAEVDANVHETMRVLSDLDREQTQVLIRVFSAIASYGKLAPTLAQFYVGYLTAYAETKYGVCPIERMRHDEIPPEVKS
jgi:hypothetical protein